MTLLLDYIEILTALVTDFCSILTHPLRHLLHLQVVIIHGTLTPFVRISDLRQTPLEHGLGFLHFSLTLRFLPSLAHSLLLLHQFNFLAQSYMNTGSANYGEDGQLHVENIL